MDKSGELAKLKKEKNIKFGGWQFTRSRLRHSIDESFFNQWTSQMAYIVGFTYADGNIYRTSLSWDVQVGDLDILQKIKKAVKCTYPIIKQHKGASYRLRITNQTILPALSSLGLIPKKKFRKTIPKIPVSSIRHFVRGFLDGDGWIAVREKKGEINVGFCGGNRNFLIALNRIISKALSIKQGRVREKFKLTPKLVKSTTYQLEFYTAKAFKLVEWVYGGLEPGDLFLKRKYKKYLEAKELNTFILSGSKKIRIVQKREGRNIKQILDELYSQKGFDGVQIAKILGVHSSSIYRWLAQVNIKYPVRRI